MPLLIQMRMDYHQFPEQVTYQRHFLFATLLIKGIPVKALIVVCAFNGVTPNDAYIIILWRQTAFHEAGVTPQQGLADKAQKLLGVKRSCNRETIIRAFQV